jgi:hypothetical protein
MTNMKTRLPSLASGLISGTIWLATEQIASAQPLLAQTGTTKTAIGWTIVLLCLGLGLLVVCRSSVRNPPQQRTPKAKK